MDININGGTFRDTFNGVFDIGIPPCSAVIHRNFAVVRQLLRGNANFSEPGSRPISYVVKSGRFLPAPEPLLRASANPAEAFV